MFHRLRRDRSAAEHEAEPSEGTVGNSTGQLVHAEAQHREEDATEHHHNGDDLVCVLLRMEGRGEQHQGGGNERPEHEALAVRQLLRGVDSVEERDENDDAEEDKGQTGKDVHEKLL